MDYAAVATDSRFEDVDNDRKRLDAFKLGGSAPSSSGSSHRAHKPSHSRSHSRHTSSVSISLSAPSVSSLPPVSPSSPPASPPPTTGGSKRSSHHRRRSSVSTRRESAEIMGVTLPTFSASSSEDNINLGDKDSIRRRALLALEGRTEVGAFSRVEIPELSTPDIEKRFDFPTKPSYPPGIGAGYGGSLNSMASSKRDSFGKYMSMSSSKDILGTLVEEEEEEEPVDNAEEATQPAASVWTTDADTVASPAELPNMQPALVHARPRPATLKLRPLSLSPNLVQATDPELPTPAATPSPRPGLRSLTLPSALGSESNVAHSSNAMPVASRRQSMFINGSSFQAAPTRRSSVSGAVDATTVPSHPSRRTSISYFSCDDKSAINNYGLPTPEMTPISDRRHSQESSSSGSRSSRSLSTSEQHFLYQAHNALVQRISDLERALSARPRSRPQSYDSDSSAQSDTPSNEILQLVADLKAERDELKKDVDGWRTRVTDFEQQIALLMKRVETERREAWVARERVGLMELEKKSVEISLAEKISWGEQGWKKSQEARDALVKAEEECRRLRPAADRVPDLELEISRLTVALAEERTKREETEKELESVLSTPTPQAFELSQYRTPPVSRTMVFAKRGGLGFRSVDSTSSSTDVDSVDESFDRPQLSLKVVHEEDEDDNDLARYEDEDENDDYEFQASMSDSSFESDCDEPRDTSHLIESSTDLPELSASAASSSPSTPAPPSPPARHERRASWVKAWTFPQGTAPNQELVREAEEIDRFFGCLEDVDNSPPLESKLRSAESEKNLFAQALTDTEDDVPFMIPSNVGVEVPMPSSKSNLDVIAEDEEEEEDVASDDIQEEIVGQEVDGGIIFTFTPPPSFEGLELPEAEKPCAIVEEPQPMKLSMLQQTPPVSSIPRSNSYRSFTSNIPVHSSSTPVKSMPVRGTADSSSPSSATPTKRNPPSSAIPRLQSSPSASAVTPPKAQSSSFIPQPRKSSVSTQKTVAPTQSKTPPKPRTSMFRASQHMEPAAPHMRSAVLPRQEVSSASGTNASSPSSSFMSPTFAAIQTLTNFIPLPAMPWSPKIGSPTAAPMSSSSSAFSLSSSASEGDVCSITRPPAPVLPKARGFVPREKQLAKLKLRLDREGHSKSVGFSSDSLPSRRRYHAGILDL